VGVDQAGGGHADAFVSGEPFVIVETAVMVRVIGQVMHGIGGRFGEGRDGCGVEVNELPGDWELGGVAVPQRGVGHFHTIADNGIRHGPI
jgi:hypothetical protein